MEGVGEYCRGRRWNRGLTGGEGGRSPMSLLGELQEGIWASRDAWPGSGQRGGGEVGRLEGWGWQTADSGEGASGVDIKLR